MTSVPFVTGLWIISLASILGRTKQNQFSLQVKIGLKNIGKLDIHHGEVKIKQHSKVTYLGCILDEDMSGESMATKVLGKINAKLRFLYRKNKFLTSSLHRLLCNALIQPHPNLNKKLSTKLQTSQNKCIRFCLQLGNRSHIGASEFEQINWLPVKERFVQCVSAIVFKYIHNLSPIYMAEIFVPFGQSTLTRNSAFKLVQPFR